uniref:ATP-binding protein n=1 Tax=Anisakis simplex TaxID=6269 RepID=A0A0M3JMB1_ANISI
LVQWALTVAPSNAVVFLTTSQRDMADGLNEPSGCLAFGADLRG